MATTNDCIGYIDKLEYFGTNYSPGKLLISGCLGGYSNTNIIIDNIRYGSGYGKYDYSSSGSFMQSFSNFLSQSGVLSDQLFYFDGLETITNGVSYNLQHGTGMTNVCAYISWGSHSSLGSSYPNDGEVQWKGDSRWWIIETFESYNGFRDNSTTGQATFLKWFTSDAFGGSNYSGTPVGAVSHTDEPFSSLNDYRYFCFWLANRSFGVSSWMSRKTTFFQSVGDPLIKR
jgi:hypothetical protein